MEKKTIKQTIISISTSVILFAGVATTINGKGYTALFAHDAQLEVLYDSCIPENYSDLGDIVGAEDEKWYLLDDGSETRHIGDYNDVPQISYYVYDSSADGNISWNYILDPVRREHVKNCLINGILKWNNIYLYKQASAGTITKHKLVEMYEGSASNHHISVFPNESNDWDGICGPSYDHWDYIDTYQGINHFHFDKWEINFSLKNQQYYSDSYLSRIGAHEFGHVLGLVDIDGCECYDPDDYHHAELLMGYESPSQSEITYKDLIGAAITRGLHTDDDHQWIYYSSGHGAYKLVCSICNGVRYVSSLDGIDYVDYKDCNDEHDLADGNMFAVASYGNSDYYKCKYCRYVAPFDDIEPQNYSKSQYNSLNHIVTNQVTGLGYSFYEPHTYNDYYNNYNSTQHKAYCECGRYTLMPHVADMSHSYTVFGHTYAPCLYCGTAIEIGGNGPIIPIPGSNDLMITDNGSYIMPNGIYVIMEEDLEAFLSGTLVFHPYGEVEA